MKNIINALGHNWLDNNLSTVPLMYYGDDAVDVNTSDFLKILLASELRISDLTFHITNANVKNGRLGLARYRGILKSACRCMMMSSNGNIFRVTGHLCGEIQWRGALMFSLICVWINGWVNNREAGDLRRYRAHYDVIVMGLIHDVPMATIILHRYYMVLP